MTVFSIMGDDHKINQDVAYVINTGKIHAYVVCDGHGSSGEVISGYVAPKVAPIILSYILKYGDFENFNKVAKAVKDAVSFIDNDVKKRIPEAYYSGCTIAGVIVDITTGVGYMISIGDSLVIAVLNNNREEALHLQNAANAPPFITKAASDLSWRTKRSYIGSSPRGTKYMIFPEDNGPIGGLQLYSSIGDFDLKQVNPIVGLYPQVVMFKKRGFAEIRFLVTSDGYLDGIPHKPLTVDWYKFIRHEMDITENDAKALVSMAINRGSYDDITVISFAV